MDDVNKLAIAKDDGFIFDEALGGRKLELHPAPPVPMVTDIDDKVGDLEMKGAVEQEHGDEDTEEEINIPELKLKRSTRSWKTPRRFRYLNTVAIKEQVRVKETFKRSDGKQWQWAIKEELKSINENGT